MKKSRFSEVAIIAVLNEHAARNSVAEPCRKHGIGDATFYAWRKPYGGMEVSEARRPKALESECIRGPTGTSPGGQTTRRCANG
ncbi:hypothetical protein DLJ53_03240 [Acuticoccus sediminis]|uniref:Transposase n=1 Tax=Acuticoccus sediminis TaxID=2184697 RepID=A0A8B2NVX8_9HYPH|nr:hypothetical protein DLJ53_03240 [Acuticoccus sediminis]